MSATPEEIARLISYDPETGDLWWKDRAQEEFSSYRTWRMWRAKYQGKQALHSIDSNGYYCGRIGGKFMRAHRVAWTIFYGTEPPPVIDHVDGDRLNNRITNLRRATVLENTVNRRSALGSSSKYLGVCLRQETNRWQASIKLDGKQCHLGFFSSEEEAARRYDVMAAKHFGQFARLNFPGGFDG